MNLSILTQPHAPTGEHQTAGAHLNERLNPDVYSTFVASVGYAVSSGTSRIFGRLRHFIEAGGAVTVYLGARNGTSSRQAVGHLLAAGAEVRLCDTRGGSLFHPKVYLFSGSTEASLIIGSSNMTQGGLYTNYETASVFLLDLADHSDRTFLDSVRAWFDQLPEAIESCVVAAEADLGRFVDEGLLVDESLQKVGVSRPSTRRSPRERGRRIVIPAAPPPHPDALPTYSGRTTHVATGARARARVASAGRGRHRFFAMTLSEFDCSHRRGTPGTPEVSIPEAAVAFFPRTGLSGRRYPDAYFDVLLNQPDGEAKKVNYRVWQRPPGSVTGHADWRINVKHATIDLTRPGGGDVLLLERLPEGSDPAYEVWVVQPSEPSHASLLARLDQEVRALGRAGTKHFGFF